MSRRIRSRELSASRSANMRAIRSKGNLSTERRLRSLLARHGVTGWRLHEASLPGNPDFFFPDARLVLFIDGCFWHGCPKCGHIPKTNVRYWRRKILGNKKRDAVIRKRLRTLGFSVLQVWECELKRNPSACISRITRTIAMRNS